MNQYQWIVFAIMFIIGGLMFQYLAMQQSILGLTLGGGDTSFFLASQMKSNIAGILFMLATAFFFAASFEKGK
ncbi:hypothetical protein ACFLQN_02005 [Candidatus Aenigmatarchaeota archaeon]